MSAICIGLTNMLGTAIVSDSDHTIYKFQSNLPIALAVNPHSPIPWDLLINQYKCKGEIKTEEDIYYYALDFQKFVSSIPAPDSWRSLTDTDTNIIFWGYGEKDIFPAICDITFEYNENKKNLECKCADQKIISTNYKSNVNILGEIEEISTLLFGVTRNVKGSLLKIQNKQFEIYKQRVLNHFKNTKYEDYINKKLSKYEAENSFAENLDDSSDRIYSKVQVGLSSFSIEDLATSAETLVNAQVRLKHLATGGKTNLTTAKEIAVVTRTEGVTWLKHSLFAL